MKKVRLEKLLQGLEFQEPVYEYDIDLVDGPGGEVYVFEYVSNWDAFLALGNVLKIEETMGSSARILVFLVGHICEEGGVGDYSNIYPPFRKLIGVAHISQLFKEDP